MAENIIQICRLCLNVIENTYFEFLESFRIAMLKTVLVNLNISISHNPTICCKCAEILQKCFDFKMSCLNSEDNVKTFINRSESTKVKLEDVCFKELYKDDKVCNGQRICRLCFSLDGDFYTNVNDALEDRSLQDMLNSCVPELNLDLTNDTLVCKACLNLLRLQYKFMANCLELEKKIKLYSDVTGNNSSNIIDLYSVRQFFGDIQMETKVETDTVKLENTSSDTSEAIFIKTEPNCEILKTEELVILDDMNIKHEYSSENKQEKREEENRGLLKEEENQINNIMEQNSIKLLNPAKIFGCTRCTYVAEKPYDLKNHMVIHKSPSEVMIFQCSICNFKTERKHYLKVHSLIHMDSNEVTMFKCANCSYETRKKDNLRDHVLIHSIYPVKCVYCPTVAKNFKCLKGHIRRIHKGKRMFQCLQCSILYSDKLQLDNHNLMHKTLKMFQCNYCNYETRVQGNLKDHLLVHIDIPDDCLFKCDICGFKCKRKRNLRDHILLHDDSSEALYNCKKCTYSTTLFRNFKVHAKVHRNLGIETFNKHTKKVNSFKCNNCDFQSKYKGSLKIHMLRHDPSRQVYKCEKCDYSSKILKYLKKHGKVHKDDSDVTFFKCNDCNFQSKYKESLRNHVLAHIKEKMKNKNCKL